MNVIYQVSEADLQALLAKAVAEGIAKHEERARPLLTVADMAKRYNCSRDTIYERERAGRLPRRTEAGKWARADIERWEQDRQSLSAS